MQSSAGAWLGARETHSSVDVGFRLAERDRRVTAGALGLGYPARVESALRDVGVGSSLIKAADDVSHQSQAVDWSLLVLGGWLVLWTGYMAATALVLVHAAVWAVPLARPYWERPTSVGATRRRSRVAGRVPGWAGRPPSRDCSGGTSAPIQARVSAGAVPIYPSRLESVLDIGHSCLVY